MKCCIRKFLCFVSIILFCSCTTTRYIHVEKVSTDTVYKSTIMRDSLWLHDSIYVKETSSGDTIYLNIEKWHTKFVERLRVDTMVRVRVDSVPKPYPVEKFVEKDLSWWQRFRLGLGSAVLIGIVGFVGWKLRRFLH